MTARIALRLLVVTAMWLASRPAVAEVHQVSAERDGPDALQVAIEAARPGDVIEVGVGTYAGPVHIDRTLVLRGRGGVIDGAGLGRVLVVDAPGARIEGLSVRNSGADIGASDACIYIEPGATGAVVRDSDLEHCAFGIWVHETEAVELLDNRISGQAGVRESDRGNGIHLFDGSALVVRGNRVTGVRDGIYVSATEQSLIEGNVTNHVRFGIHYMYSYHNTIRGNQADDNTVGIALMESRYLVVEKNRAVGNRRNGLLFRDVQDSEIRYNHLARNGNGVFFFSSVDNVIEDNEIVDNEMGLKIWAGTRRNRVSGNLIRGNREQVFYVGAEDQIWGEEGRGNRWGDYLGWDQNGDGVGDRPHRVDSFTATLLYRYPGAALLLRSPALEMLAHLSDRLPLLRTPTIVDVSPVLAEVEP